MQTYKIAGLVVEMDPKFDRLKKQAEPYLYTGKGKADMTLVLEERFFEKAKAKFPQIEDGDIEYMLLGALFHDRLLDFDGMMLHSSAVAVGGRAYVFSADSGVGKSTHTAYWKELIESAVIVNDDKPALRFMDGYLYVCGTPFSGKHDISVNRKYLLGGICFLSRGTENKIEDITALEAVELILAQTSSMHEKSRMEKRLMLIDRVLKNAKLYKMQCTNDISAAKVAYEKMNVCVPVRLSQLLPVIDETLDSGGKITFMTNGKSMLPLLNGGRDSVTVEKCERYKKGDVILFRKDDGDFVLHRIIKVKDNTLITEGDSLLGKDDPITREHIKGKAVAFIIDGKDMKITDFSYKKYCLLHTSFVGRILRKIKRKIIRK